MLSYGEALTAIESNQVTIDNASEVLEAIKRNVKQVLDEKRKVVARIATIEDNLQSVMSIAGVNGESLEEQVKELQSKLKVSKSEYDKLKGDFEQLEKDKAAIAEEKTKLEAQQVSFQRNEHLEKLAIKAGVNKTVLASLLKDVELEKIAIAEDEIKIDGKPFKEWAESDAIKPFAPALFEGQTQVKNDQQPTNRFPAAPPAKGGSDAIDTNAAYIRATGRDPSKTDWITKRNAIG